MHLIDGRDPLEEDPKDGQFVVVLTEESELLVATFEKHKSVKQYKDNEGYLVKILEWMPLPTRAHYHRYEMATVRGPIEEEEFECVFVRKEE